jgi:hypothetical protein
MTGIKTEGKLFLKKNAEIGTDYRAAPVVGRSSVACCQSLGKSSGPKVPGGLNISSRSTMGRRWRRGADSL